MWGTERTMANRRANACAANPTSDLAISNETLHLDRFLSFNRRKNRFSWNGDVDDLEQFLEARFVMGIEDGDTVIYEIQYQGQKSKSQVDVSELLNTFFTEIGPSLSRNVENVETTYEEFLCATDKEFAFEETTCAHIRLQD